MFYREPFVLETVVLPFLHYRGVVSEDRLKDTLWQQTGVVRWESIFYEILKLCLLCHRAAGLKAVGCLPVVVRHVDSNRTW